jgi:hypothetical protein
MFENKLLTGIYTAERKCKKIANFMRFRMRILHESLLR